MNTVYELYVHGEARPFIIISERVVKQVIPGVGYIHETSTGESVLAPYNRCFSDRKEALKSAESILIEEREKVLKNYEKAIEECCHGS